MKKPTTPDVDKLTSLMIAEVKSSLRCTSDGNHLSLRQIAAISSCSHMAVSRHLNNEIPDNVTRWFRITAAIKLLKRSHGV